MKKDLGSTYSPNGGEAWEEQKGMWLRGFLVGDKRFLVSIIPRQLRGALRSGSI